MKIITVLALLFTYQNGIELRKIEFFGLDFFVNRSEIENTFGKAEIKNPNYECGFYSDDSQGGGPYYQLMYDDFNYIGSDKEGFQIEKIRFDEKNKLFITYEGVIINYNTTADELCDILGYSSNDPEKDSFLIYSKSGDDGVLFFFEDNRLKTLEYHSPC